MLVKPASRCLLQRKLPLREQPLLVEKGTILARTKGLAILTMRNRDGSNGMNLLQAITAVRRLHPHREIHCCFCRSLSA